jgi:hypothetical protein
LVLPCVSAAINGPHSGYATRASHSDICAANRTARARNPGSIAVTCLLAAYADIPSVLTANITGAYFLTAHADAPSVLTAIIIGTFFLTGSRYWNGNGQSFQSFFFYDNFIYGNFHAGITCFSTRGIFIRGGFPASGICAAEIIARA